MKMSKLVGRRIKEDPKDAKTVSHKFLIRGGYIRPVSAGIYSLLPTGERIVKKIEAIIREEMNRIDGQEVLMPVVLPADLWQESGRYESVGAELLRFRDRNEKPMILAMTHEEAIVHLVRTELNSYKQLPVMLYQIQTKYRDEARPRAGLIRTREFTMKDAYSFHTDQADLERCYARCHEAYERIFRRVGMKNVLSIESNSGMMGGKVSHEFMAICDCGEDTVITNADYSYRANREIAVAAWKFEKGEPLPLEKVHTPGMKTIEDVAGFLGVKPENTGKAVFYQDAHTGELIFVLIRGDFEVNEVKLANALKVSELKFADDAAIEAAGAVPGFASPVGIDPAKARIIVDRSAAASIRSSRRPTWLWWSAPTRRTTTTGTSTSTATWLGAAVWLRTSPVCGKGIPVRSPGSRCSSCAASRWGTSSSSGPNIPTRCTATTSTATASRIRWSWAVTASASAGRWRR